MSTVNFAYTDTGLCILGKAIPAGTSYVDIGGCEVRVSVTGVTDFKSESISSSANTIPFTISDNGGAPSSSSVSATGGFADELLVWGTGLNPAHTYTIVIKCQGLEGVLF